LPDSAVSFSCSTLIAISHYLVRPNDCHSFSRRDCSACYPPCTSPKLKSRNRFVRARVYCNIIYYVIAARVRVPTYMRVSIRRGGRDQDGQARREEKKENVRTTTTRDCSSRTCSPSRPRGVETGVKANC